MECTRSLNMSMTLREFIERMISCNDEMRLRLSIGRHATHLGRSGFADFDVPLECCWVHEAEIERRDGHDIGTVTKMNTNWFLRIWR